MSEEDERRGSEIPSVRGVYGISVAAELSGFGVAALRLYEDYGLITPSRTGGGSRRYSDYDLARLGRIAELITAGVNLVGIGRVLDLETRTGELERDNRRLAADNAQLGAEQATATDTGTTSLIHPRDDTVEDQTVGEVARSRRPPEPAALGGRHRGGVHVWGTALRGNA